jgi:hypothetical protein
MVENDRPLVSLPKAGTSHSLNRTSQRRKLMWLEKSAAATVGDPPLSCLRLGFLLETTYVAFVRTPCQDESTHSQGPVVLLIVAFVQLDFIGNL